MKKPKIRFKGFTETWEQRKLSDVVDSVDTGKSRFDKEGSSGEYPILGSTSVIGYDDEYDYEGDFILTARVGANAGSLYRHAGKVKISDNTVFIQASQNIEFLYQLLIQFDIKKLSFGTGQPLVKASELKSLELMMPTDMKEQMRIGVYFKNIDHLITLHQRKCENLKKLKKFMLQKLFPQNGESVPKIRFSGFTDTWEQRKLREICSRVQGNDGRMELPTLTISAANGWMKQEDRFTGNIAGKEQKNYTLLHKGELSYNHGNSKLAKYGTVFSLQTYEEALVPRVYHSFKVEIGSADFIEYFFATKMPDRELRKLISSGARMDGLLNIGYDDFMGIKMMFPSVLEQDKIAEYFRAFDHLITLHQSKCDKLKEVKKYMLQNMFI